MWIDLTDMRVYGLLYEIRQARPSVSFPEPMTNESIEAQGFAKVQRVDPPQVDPIYETLVEVPPLEIDGVWTQQWQIESASEQEVADRLLRRRQSMIVTPFQAKAALLDAGLLDDIEALIADPAADRKVVLAWNNVISFERLSPMVAGIAAALGWTDEELDGLFEAAAQIA